jgi:hypothetical protein
MNISIVEAGHSASNGARVATAIVVVLSLVGFGMTSAYADEHGNRGHERHRSHHYAQPSYYAPAPVYYAPQPSPGISLFIPVVIR